MLNINKKGGLFVVICTLQVFVTYGKLRCLNCVDVLEPRLYHYVRHCLEGQVCFTEQYETTDYQILYRLGCRSQSTCLKHNTTSGHKDTKSGDRITVALCTDCCSSDLCNFEGCGAQGYPQSLIGPVCYNCPQSRDVETCDRISVCKTDESCFIQKESEFDSSFFSTKCLQTDLCNIERPNVIGKRSNNRKREIDCLRCCKNNLCNNICNEDGMTTNAISSTPTTATGTRSTEFVVMFIPNLMHVNENIELILTSNSRQSMITLMSAVNGISRNVTLSNHSVHVNLSRDIVHVDSDVIQNKGLYIQSTEPISVHGYSVYNPSCCTSSAFTALPVDMFGTDYIAITFPPGSGSQIGIVAPEDGSLINVIINTTQSGTITFNQHTYVHGDTISMILNRSDTVRIKSLSDLTGTKIHSNKRIGVISGSTCTSYPKNTECDNVVSMLPPTNEFGLNFIIPRINPAKKMILRVVPSIDGTNIEVHSNIYHNTYTLNKTVEVELLSENLTFVYCSRPCLVVQLCADGDSTFNPFMTIVPSTKQFSNRYVLDTPTIKPFTNYVSITVKTSNLSGLRYNGQVISSGTVSALDKYNVDWTSITFRIKTGTSFINHLSSNVYFGLIQYGFGSRDQEAYGFSVAYS